MNKWNVYGIGEQCDRYGISKTIINDEGKYEPIFHPKTYAHSHFAEVIASRLNDDDNDLAWLRHCLITANGTEEQIEAYIKEKHNGR